MIKTAYEIYSEQRKHYDMDTKQTYEELVKSGEQKWVPLEEAERLEAKIVEALKIIEEEKEFLIYNTSCLKNLRKCLANDKMVVKE